MLCILPQLYKILCSHYFLDVRRMKEENAITCSIFRSFSGQGVIYIYHPESSHSVIGTVSMDMND